VKAQRALSDEQERLRIEGLRALARIIARHAHARPGLYKDGFNEERAGPTALEGHGDADGPSDRTDDAA